MERSAKFVSDLLGSRNLSELRKKLSISPLHRQSNLSNSAKNCLICIETSTYFDSVPFGTIYILARENIEIVIIQNGTWEFVNETEF
ncbi:hypothetical protein NIES2104_21760 [Leptolyngbya sp. NIES-2104]|nr:hypothetical protein NIES2104_21760 [Leptolyngbya sp. NIES-2104]